MAEVQIPFMPEFKDKMLSGVKTATSRTRNMGKPGDTFEAFGAKFNVTYVNQVPLAYVRVSYWREEGAESPADFRAIWVRIHPRARWRPERVVWLHKFVRAE